MRQNLRSLVQRQLYVATDPTRWAGTVGLAVVIGIAYFLAARLSLALLTPGGVAVFWPAAGVAAGVLIALGPRARLSVALGTMAATIVANLLGDRNIWSTLIFAVSNAGEAVLTAWFIERYFGRPFSFGRLRNVLGFVAAAVVGTAVSGIGGTAGYYWFHSSTTPLLKTWEDWFSADALGIIAVAPLVIELFSAARARPTRTQLIEGTAAVAALAVTSGFVVSLPAPLLATVVPIALLFPPLLWLAARCEPIFASAAVFIVSLMIVATTIFDIGHFGSRGRPIAETALAAQASILLVALATLVLASLFVEIRDKGRQLAEASEHKSQFLANMSHELRTPLNAIIGYSEILQEDVKGLGQSHLGLDLKKIENAGRHLLGLINDILDLSKIEAGRMEVFLEDIEIAPLLDEVRAIITPLTEKSGNTLDVRLSPKLSAIRTDRTKVKQCLLNVLSNANKFTENGGITLVVDRLERDHPMVRFVVSDTGIGMTEEQLRRLFKAFSQADISTTKKFGGTGLGLAITQHFCQLLGGDIKVASRWGEGSTFTITVPDNTPVLTDPVKGPHISGDANNNAITVLVVDDDPAAHDLFTAKLKGESYRLVHANSGEEALELAREMQPDAITLDVLMPKTDGWAVLRALKADRKLCDIPVVMITVVPDRGLGLSLGAVDVLTKPVDRANLSTLLRRLARREGPVLVVEDDAGTREMVRHTIEKMGLKVAEAENGRSALLWLTNNPEPSIILLDLMMPEMDGFEFLDTFKRNSAWGNIPVIVITGMELTTTERARLLARVHQIIEKGVSNNVDIAAAVSGAVRRRPARAAASAES